MLRAEKMIIERTELLSQWFDEATEIYNQILFHLRQECIDAKAERRKVKLSNVNAYELLKLSAVWQTSALDYNVRQQVLRKADANFKAFFRACKAWKKDKSKFESMPKMPYYLKKGKQTVLVIDKTRLRHIDYENNTVVLPRSDIKIQIPGYIDLRSIKCLTLKSYYGKVKVGISYEKEVKEQKRLNKNNAIGIDIGVNNIIAITASNQPKSWIVKGGKIKSINQFYNKKVAQMRSELKRSENEVKTSKRIMRFSMKRKNMIDYQFHCLSKEIIKCCIDNDIGTIVICHNDGWKQKSNMGKKGNQKFVQIPFNDLIFKIQYKAEEAGINVIVHEESYTSKIDHLANEALCKHDNYLGDRIKRGLFKSSVGKVLNADCNGAIGILRKAHAISDADLVSLRDRGDVVSPRLLRYGA